MVASEELAAAGCPLPRLDQSQIVPLSRREREVVRLVAEGKSNKQISSDLAISVRTVETYRARLMLKLNATSTAQLIRYAIRSRLVAI
jgi:DNA-binding CsgD family transcriptional regulator